MVVRRWYEGGRKVARSHLPSALWGPLSLGHTHSSPAAAPQFISTSFIPPLLLPPTRPLQLAPILHLL